MLLSGRVREWFAPAEIRGCGGIAERCRAAAGEVEAHRSVNP